MNLDVELRPFGVPTHVVLVAPEGPWQPKSCAMEVPIHDVSADILAAMCDEFRASVFQGAGKADPALAAKGE